MKSLSTLVFLGALSLFGCGGSEARTLTPPTSSTSVASTIDAAPAPTTGTQTLPVVETKSYSGTTWSLTAPVAFTRVNATAPELVLINKDTHTAALLILEKFDGPFGLYMLSVIRQAAARGYKVVSIKQLQWGGHDGAAIEMDLNDGIHMFWWATLANHEAYNFGCGGMPIGPKDLDTIHQTCTDIADTFEVLAPATK